MYVTYNLFVTIHVSTEYNHSVQTLNLFCAWIYISKVDMVICIYRWFWILKCILCNDG